MKTETLPLYKRLDWVNTIFLTLSPIVVLTWTPLHIYWNGLQPSLIIFFVIFSIMTSLSITSGYHRLFAHLSYEARPWVRFLFLVFGAASLQSSAMKWCTDHRRHHQFTDTEKDPYSIKKGFWYAHMGWIFFKELPEYKGKFAPDLARDPLIRWQHKYYFPLAVIVGFGLPTLVGWMLGSAGGGLLFGGFLRVVFLHHCTFFINSLCHCLGSQPYGDDTSARDSMIMAFFTYGEGYHNFHHQFQSDYRNGVRWYQWDPSKWLIQILALFGFADRLKTFKEHQLIKARVNAQAKRLLEKGVAPDRVSTLKQRTEEALKNWRELQERYQVLKKEWQDQSQETLRQVKQEMRRAQSDFKMAWAAFSGKMMSQIEN